MTPESELHFWSADTPYDRQAKLVLRRLWEVSQMLEAFLDEYGMDYPDKDRGFMNDAVGLSWALRTGVEIMDSQKTMPQTRAEEQELYASCVARHGLDDADAPVAAGATDPPDGAA